MFGFLPKIIFQICNKIKISKFYPKLDSLPKMKKNLRFKCDKCDQQAHQNRHWKNIRIFILILCGNLNSENSGLLLRRKWDFKTKLFMFNYLENLLLQNILPKVEDNRFICK